MYNTGHELVDTGLHIPIRPKLSHSFLYLGTELIVAVPADTKLNTEKLNGRHTQWGTEVSRGHHILNKSEIEAKSGDYWRASQVVLCHILYNT